MGGPFLFSAAPSALARFETGGCEIEAFVPGREKRMPWPRRASFCARRPHGDGWGPATGRRAVLNQHGGILSGTAEHPPRRAVRRGAPGPPSGLIFGGRRSSGAGWRGTTTVVHDRGTVKVRPGPMPLCRRPTASRAGVIDEGLDAFVGNAPGVALSATGCRRSRSGPCDPRVGAARAGRDGSRSNRTALSAVHEAGEAPGIGPPPALELGKEGLRSTGPRGVRRWRVTARLAGSWRCSSTRPARSTHARSSGTLALAIVSPRAPRRGTSNRGSRWRPVGVWAWGRG
jgi:hypothetical protein